MLFRSADRSSGRRGRQQVAAALQEIGRQSDVVIHEEKPVACGPLHAEAAGARGQLILCQDDRHDREVGVLPGHGFRRTPDENDFPVIRPWLLVGERPERGDGPFRSAPSGRSFPAAAGNSLGG